MSALLDRLPPAWRLRFAGDRIERSRHGETGAEVYRLVDGEGTVRFLKLAADEEAAALRAEAVKLLWLQARDAPVPPLLDWLDDRDIVALWTRALPGRSAAEAPKGRSDAVIAAAETMRRLHAISLEAWPFGSADEARFTAACARVTANEVSSRHFADEHRGVTPVLLLDRLKARRAALPARPPVMTHGDADLANLILDDEGRAGFVDCGDAGPADAYLDLFVMADSIAARFGDEAARLFFAAYGIASPDPARLAYYRLLDEFF